MVSRMVSTMLSGLMFWLTFGWTSTSAYSPRTPDRVSETDMQRLLHGVMEQLGIARPRVEYPAHQAMNLVGPQSIEGCLDVDALWAAVAVGASFTGLRSPAFWSIVARRGIEPSGEVSSISRKRRGKGPELVVGGSRDVISNPIARVSLPAGILDFKHPHKLFLGGAHEGLQHLGPFGNIPNIVAELTGDNIPKDFSEDQGYPDPPNPCPVGKTADDGCLEHTPDTAEFSREFQLHQHLYDPEHDYPGLGKWNKKLLYEKMKAGQRRKRRSVNPYLQGQRLDNVVAKKSVPHFSDEDKDPE